LVVAVVKQVVQVEGVLQVELVVQDLQVMLD
jgi:hypothetical protein